MHTEEIERLLRRARPPELPHGWKRQILGPLPQPKSQPVFLRLSWSGLAACWALILLLRLSMPDVPQGTVPFDYVAYAARHDAMKRLAATGELAPPPVEPLRIESIFHLPAPQKPPTT